jgi:hypothetical protein
VAEFDFPQRERERHTYTHTHTHTHTEHSLDPYLNMAMVGGGGDRRFLTDDEG